jgi:hypothetical protein
MSVGAPPDFAIDEFKALRDEIKRCESESLSITLYVFTAVVLAVGLMDRPWLPKHAVPILVQTALLWAMHRYHALTSLRVRLSTYVQVMLEPALPGLRWEARNQAFESFSVQSYYFSSKPGSWCLHRFTQVFFLLTVIGIYLSVISLLQIPHRNFSFFILAGALGVLHTMSTLLMIKCVFLRASHSGYIRIWQGIREGEQNTALAAGEKSLHESSF